MAGRDRCERCGEDTAVFRRVERLANRYYNEGLKKARVRDLSGAVAELRNCLKLDKTHTDARNLLGLIYEEMGETVSALSEWVVSRHFQSKENAAERYINMVQENPSRLDSVNQIIKKYNGALTAARQGNGDLAILQLKKVVSLNPHYVQAQQLLGLLYLHMGERDRAEKCLLRAAKVDVANTTTLAYLEELGIKPGTEQQRAPRQAERSRKPEAVQDRDVITPIHAYTEDKPNIIAWVNLVLGLLIGAAFIMIAIVPGIQKNSVQDNSSEVVALNERMVKLQAELEAAQNEKEDLSKEILDLQAQLKEAQEAEVVKEDLTIYETLMQSAAYYAMENEDKAAEKLILVDKDKLELPMAVTLYNKLSNQIFEEQSAEKFQEGHNLYSNGSFEEALEVLKDALKMNSDNVDAIYFIGRSYHRLGEVDTAKKWYNRLVEKYPETGRANEAASRLRELE